MANFIQAVQELTYATHNNETRYFESVAAIFGVLESGVITVLFITLLMGWSYHLPIEKFKWARVFFVAFMVTQLWQHW